MKRCPECRQDYYDDMLLYCLDDGNTLLEGPTPMDEPTTAILHSAGAIGDAPTRAQVHTTEQTAVLSSEIRDAGKRGFDKRLLVVPVFFAIIGLGVYLGYRYLGSDTKQIESIAVMPFVNESGNADVEYLSDGMTETLISNLSQLPKLHVKARSSVFRYKGREIDAQTIGKELSVQAILNGRIIQRGDNLTLYLSLVDAQTGNQIWGEPYNRKMIDLISLQSEIARDVSQKLQTKLSGADEQRLAKSYTESAEAYQLYLRGRFYWNKRTAKDIEKAIGYFQQSVALDPNYALAYAGLADAYSLLPTYGGAPSHEVLPKAREAALRALSFDNQLADAHVSLGLVLNFYDYDFAGAEREFKTAIELNPNSANAHQFYGNLLSQLGRHTESSARLSRALEIEPLLLTTNRLYGIILFYARKYDESIAQLIKTIELDPSFAAAHDSLASVYFAKGNYAESVEEFAKSQELSGASGNAALAREGFARGGWQGFLRSMTGESRPANLASYRAATFLAALGEKDKAFAELNKAFEEREFFMILLKVDSRLDPLRDDPRFSEMVKKVGLPN